VRQMMDAQKLEEMWNAQADKLNDWDELGLDEIVAFAVEITAGRCAEITEQRCIDYDIFIGHIYEEDIAKAIRKEFGIERSE